MEDRGDTVRNCPGEAGCTRAKGSIGLNEAWRYLGSFANNVSFVGALLKEFKWKSAAFVVAVGAEYNLESQNKNKKHH